MDNTVSVGRKRFNAALRRARGGKGVGPVTQQDVRLRHSKTPDDVPKSLLETCIEDNHLAAIDRLLAVGATVNYDFAFCNAKLNTAIHLIEAVEDEENATRVLSSCQRLEKEYVVGSALGDQRVPLAVALRPAIRAMTERFEDVVDVQDHLLVFLITHSEEDPSTLLNTIDDEETAERVLISAMVQLPVEIITLTAKAAETSATIAIHFIHRFGGVTVFDLARTIVKAYVDRCSVYPHPGAGMRLLHLLHAKGELKSSPPFQEFVKERVKSTTMEPRFGTPVRFVFQLLLALSDEDDIRSIATPHSFEAEGMDLSLLLSFGWCARPGASVPDSRFRWGPPDAVCDGAMFVNAFTGEERETAAGMSNSELSRIPLLPSGSLTCVTCGHLKEAVPHFDITKQYSYISDLAATWTPLHTAVVLDDAERACELLRDEHPDPFIKLAKQSGSERTERALRLGPLLKGGGKEELGTGSGGGGGGAGGCASALKDE